MADTPTEQQARADVAAYSAKLTAMCDLLDQAAALNRELEQMEVEIGAKYPANPPTGFTTALGLPNGRLSWHLLRGQYTLWRASVHKWLSERGYHTTPADVRETPEDHPWED